MWWVIAGLAVLVAGLAIGWWLLGPTLRTFRGPDFEPASADDTAALRAQQPGTTPGAGGVGA